MTCRMCVTASTSFRVCGTRHTTRSRRTSKDAKLPRTLCDHDCICHAELEEQQNTQGPGFVGKMMDQTGQVRDLICEPWDRSSKVGKQCIRFCTYTRNYCQCPLYSLVEPSAESW